MTDGRDRRSVLRASVALCSVGLAGCVIGGGGDGGSSNGTAESGSNGPEPTEPEPVTSWPMQQYDAGNTAAVPDAEVPEDGVEELWRLDLGERVRSSPVVADGMVYVRDRAGTVHAVDETGDEQWMASVPDGEHMTTPAIYEDLLLVPHDAGVIAFDRNEGTDEWEYTSEAGTTDLTVADDAVFFADTHTGVHAVEAGTGEERWTYGLNPSRGSYAYPPAVDDGTVYVPTVAGGRADSWEISTFPTESNDKGSFFESEAYGFSAGVSVTQNRIVAPTPSGIRAYDRDGEKLWQFSTAKPVQAGVAVGGDLVAGISTENVEATLHVLDARTGDELWESSFWADGMTVPILANSSVVVGTLDEQVAAYDGMSGEVQWSEEAPFSRLHQGTFSNGQFYFAGSEGRLIAYGKP